MAKVKAKLPGEVSLKNPKEELFCWIYAGYHNRNLFGNGTQCYMLVYYADEIKKLEDEIDKLEGEKEKAVVGSRSEVIASNKKFDIEINPRYRKIKSIEKVASTLSSRMLGKVGVRARVDYLIDSYISETHSDRELQYVILQRFDLNSKVQGIKEFNRLKDRGSKGNLEGNFTFSWEDELESKPGTKKRPVLKKAEVKIGTDVEWEGDK